ncbi:MAG TPA: cytidylate kinase-like family protein [Thermoanaerobaculia bacterium]|nr:cytidylate kinase-like family protein [Thermoanaerobaculia bacterium]HQR68462.1 cytidylate kinase-like family protein [Thermoanaerobaculia bacterium]
MTSSRKVLELADRQGLFTEVRRRSKPEGPGETRRAEGPWLAVSRQLGSGGSILAVRVAEALGWKAYDREILAAVAADTRSDEDLLTRLDEQGVAEFHEYLAPLIVPDDPGQARYLKEMTRVIARIAREGRAVLVGRGANWILTPSRGLRIRAVGARDARAVFLAEAEGIALDKARKQVEENDAAQKKFIRQAFNRDIDDPAGYDLILNPIDLGLEASVAAVVSALKAKLDL